jgi:hypothetical protein
MRRMRSWQSQAEECPEEKRACPSKETNGRIYLDIATVKKIKDGPNVTKPNWHIMVDEKTKLKFSDFFTSKIGMVEPTCEQFTRWKQEAGHPVKFICLDNAGENKTLIKSRAESTDWKFDIQFEFTVRDTPQQNHYAELGFTVLANKGHAVMHRANIPLLLCYKIWQEAFKTVTLLDGLIPSRLLHGLIPIQIDGVTVTCYVHWGGRNPPAFAKHLKTWGEAGTVKLKITATSRVADRGAQCMMVRYAIDHGGDCYRMWDPTTARVHKTRDVIWLRCMFFQQQVQQVDITVEPLEFVTPDSKSREGTEEESESDNKTDDINDDDGAGRVTLQDVVTRSGHKVSKPACYIEEIGAVTSVYEIRITMSEVRSYATMHKFPKGEFTPGEVACVGAGLAGGFENTKELHVMKSKKAMKTEDSKEWKVAVNERARQYDH